MTEATRTALKARLTPLADYINTDIICNSDPGGIHAGTCGDSYIAVTLDEWQAVVEGDAERCAQILTILQGHNHARDHFA